MKLVPISTRPTSEQLYTELKNYFYSWVDKDQFSFIDRLARENNWSDNFARRALSEYIKFVYLCAISERPLTPSDEVDQVWHLHLQYVQQYHRLNQLLPQPLVHGPTEGGTAEAQKFDEWYERTKIFYTEQFTKAPPVDIWPSAEIRFKISPHAVRVNPEYYFIVSKSVGYCSLVVGLIFLGGIICLI